jgi:hypothetical protein
LKGEERINAIGDLFLFILKVGLPNIKLRTTHRISAESLATIVELCSGIQKKRRRKPAKKVCIRRAQDIALLPMADE